MCDTAHLAGAIKLKPQNYQSGFGSSQLGRGIFPSQQAHPWRKLDHAIDQLIESAKLCA
jgi:hypothetical protein